MTARTGNIRRLLLAASLLIASSACSDADRSSVANAAAANRPPAPEGPTPAASPELADRPASEQIAQQSATDAAREPNDVDWSKGDPALGQALYTTHCAICHGGRGAGDGIATPALNPKPRDFRDGRFYIDANGNNQTGEDVDLARVILNGPATFGGTRAMIGWRDALSDQDVRDLIAHIRTLASPIPAVPAGAPAS